MKIIATRDQKDQLSLLDNCGYLNRWVCLKDIVLDNPLPCLIEIQNWSETLHPQNLSCFFFSLERDAYLTAANSHVSIYN